MLSQINKIKRKSKLGVSVMIGYVLLITLAIVMGVVAYNWVKTYIPKQASECPDSVSVFIKEAGLDDSKTELTLILKNNGKFNIDGYFIYGKNSSTQQLASIDLSRYLNQSYGGIIVGNYIKFFSLDDDNLKPGNEITHVFNMPAILNLYSINVIPIRFQEESNKEKFVSCGNSAANQIIGEPTVECVAEEVSTTCGTRVCGSRANNCGDLVSCGTCTSPNVCDANGACIPPAQCTDTCATFRYTCGTWNICGVQTSCGSLNGNCLTGYGCNATGQCTLNCGDGGLDAGETCDDGNIASGDGCSSTCQIESGYGCTGQPSVCTLNCGNGIINTGEGCDDNNTISGDGCSSTCAVETGYSCAGAPSVCSINVISCPSYCVSLNLGYSSTHSACTSSPGTCASGGGTYKSGGNVWCTGGPQADTCCCKP